MACCNSMSYPTIRMITLLLLLLVLMFSFLEVQAAELTFELPDRARMCFYEEIQKDTSCALEFQVSSKE